MPSVGSLSFVHQTDNPFAHGYFGPPNSGKSYIKGCHVENGLCRTPYLNRLPAPLCVVSVHYESGPGRVPDLLHSHLPNQSPDEVVHLGQSHLFVAGEQLKSTSVVYKSVLDHY